LSNCKRILVVKLSSLGDIVHVTPCLRALRQYFPDAEIAMAVEPQFAAVVRHNPHIDTLIESRFTGPGSFPLRVLQLLWDLRGLKIDLAIDFQGNKKSAAWIMEVGVPSRSGEGGRGRDGPCRCNRTRANMPFGFAWRLSILSAFRFCSPIRKF